MTGRTRVALGAAAIVIAALVLANWPRSGEVTRAPASRTMTAPLRGGRYGDKAMGDTQRGGAAANKPRRQHHGGSAARRES
jgi:hypothetical protein